MRHYYFFERGDLLHDCVVGICEQMLQGESIDVVQQGHFRIAERTNDLVAEKPSMDMDLSRFYSVDLILAEPLQWPINEILTPDIIRRHYQCVFAFLLQIECARRFVERNRLRKAHSSKRTASFCVLEHEILHFLQSLHQYTVVQIAQCPTADVSGGDAKEIAEAHLRSLVALESSLLLRNELFRSSLLKVLNLAVELEHDFSAMHENTVRKDLRERIRNLFVVMDRIERAGSNPFGELLRSAVCVVVADPRSSQVSRGCLCFGAVSQLRQQLNFNGFYQSHNLAIE